MTDVLNDLDMNQNEIKEAVLDNLAAAPASPVPGQAYFDTVLGYARVWDGTQWDKLEAGALKFAATIGDGLALAYVIPHNLNTRDVSVTIYDTTTFVEAIATVAHTSVNSVTVTFAVPPALNAYRVVVLA